MFGLPAKSSQSEGQENLLLRFIDKNMFQDKRKDSSGEKNKCEQAFGAPKKKR